MSWEETKKEAQIWLEGQGYHHIETHLENALGLFLTAHDDLGQVFFKSGIPARAREGILSEFLAQHFPDCSPEVLALEPEKGWMLTRKMPGEALPKGNFPLEVWQNILQDYAQLQQKSQALQKPLQDLGVPVLDWVDLVLQGHQKMQSRAWLLAQELKPLEVKALLERAQAVPKWLEELRGLELPNTLIHGDFHPNNIFYAPQKTTFFDWSDAAISHPWLDFGRFFNWAFVTQLGREMWAMPQSEADILAMRHSYVQVWLEPTPSALSASSAAQKLVVPFMLGRGADFLARAGLSPARFFRIVLRCLL
jgi:hypothetical protein